ncbi:MAG: hypothetical protein ACXABV_14495, partial [Candidatus Thorarchaeota archaeon]
DDAKEAVRSIVIKKMCEQIDGGGPTIGLDIDKLIDEGKHGKLIARVELVDELRHEEMIRVTVPHVEEYHEDYHGEDETYEAYDLRGLWLTDYGFHILKELGMSLSTNENGLKRVTKALKDIGYEIPVGHRMFFSEVPMSQEMQELIWDTVR